MHKICYWDDVAREQMERDSTPEEDAQREADIGAAAAPTIPQRVPMLNAHLVLIECGWMPEIRAYLNAIPGAAGEKARTYFDKAQTMARDHDLVLAIPAALGKTEAEVDALFVAAATLNI